MEAPRPAESIKPDYYTSRERLEAKKASIEKQIRDLRENEATGASRPGEDDHLIVELEQKHEEVLRGLMALELPEFYGGE